MPRDPVKTIYRAGFVRIQKRGVKIDDFVLKCLCYNLHCITYTNIECMQAKLTVNNNLCDAQFSLWISSDRFGSLKTPYKYTNIYRI